TVGTVGEMKVVRLGRSQRQYRDLVGRARLDLTVGDIRESPGVHESLPLSYFGPGWSRRRRSQRDCASPPAGRGRQVRRPRKINPGHHFRADFPPAAGLAARTIARVVVVR